MVFEHMNIATRIHFVKSLTNNNKNYEYEITSLILRLSEIEHFTIGGAWIWTEGACNGVWTLIGQAGVFPLRKLPCVFRLALCVAAMRV